MVYVCIKYYEGEKKKSLKKNIKGVPVVASG